MGKVIYLDLYRKEKESNNTQMEFDFPLKGKPMNIEDTHSKLDNYTDDQYMIVLKMLIDMYRQD